ncbi:MAG: hypothetical protein WCV81_04955 [Microgenomates group bacterium]|jgi:hypothetical protein
MNDYLRPGIPLDASTIQLVGARNTPLNFQADHLRKKIQLQEYLTSIGIDIPLNPDPDQDTPRTWLVRGTPKTNTLSEKHLLPQTGQLGTKGVFFGECLSPVVVPDWGVVFVYPNTITSRWLNIKSRIFQKLVGYVAAKNHWNTAKIGEGATAYETVYSKYPIFSPTDGICTIPNALPVDQAQHIVMVGQGKYKDSVSVKSFPEEIQNKISFFAH